MKKLVSGGPRSGAQNGPKNLDFSWKKNKVFGANGVPKNEPENNENLEKRVPRIAPF